MLPSVPIKISEPLTKSDQTIKEDPAGVHVVPLSVDKNAPTAGKELEPQKRLVPFTAKQEMSPTGGPLVATHCALEEKQTNAIAIVRSNLFFIVLILEGVNGLQKYKI